MSSHNHAVDIAVTGMSCASCVTAVENALRKLPEVASASVNLATERAHIELANDIRHQNIVKAVVDAGYGASIVSPEQSHAHHHEDDSATGINIVIAAILSFPLIVPMLLNVVGVDWNLPVWLQW